MYAYVPAAATSHHKIELETLTFSVCFRIKML